MEEGAKRFDFLTNFLKTRHARIKRHKMLRFDFLTNFLKTRHARIKRHKMLSDHDSSKEIALFFEFAAPKFGFLQINS